MKKIVIGSDKSGFPLKEAVKAHLVELGYEVEDCGTQDMEHGQPYYMVAPVVAEKISRKEYEKGILICGTGMGMAIVANKYPGVYAAVCENTYAAEKVPRHQRREHPDHGRLDHRGLCGLRHCG